MGTLVLPHPTAQRHMLCGKCALYSCIWSVNGQLLWLLFFVIETTLVPLFLLAPPGKESSVPAGNGSHLLSRYTRTELTAALQESDYDVNFITECNKFTNFNCITILCVCFIQPVTSLFFYPATFYWHIWSSLKLLIKIHKLTTAPLSMKLRWGSPTSLVSHSKWLLLEIDWTREVGMFQVA